MKDVAVYFSKKNPNRQTVTLPYLRGTWEKETWTLAGLVRQIQVSLTGLAGDAKSGARKSRISLNRRETHPATWNCYLDPTCLNRMSLSPASLVLMLLRLSF